MQIIISNMDGAKILEDCVLLEWIVTKPLYDMTECDITQIKVNSTQGKKKTRLF